MLQVSGSAPSAAVDGERAMTPGPWAPAMGAYNGPAAQRPSGPAAQRPSGPAAQRPSGPAAQRPSGPAAQRPSGPAAQRPSGPAASLLQSRKVPRARGRTVLSGALRTAAVLALAVIAAATLSERPAQAQTPQNVAPGWQYIPSGFSEGQSFRLLFVTSTKTAASSTSISTYNSFVQGRAAANTHLSGFSSQFRGLAPPRPRRTRGTTPAPHRRARATRRAKAYRSTGWAGRRSLITTPIFTMEGGVLLPTPTSRETRSRCLLANMFGRAQRAPASSM